MSKLLSRREALEILERVGCSQRVINHCKAVARLSLKIAKKLQSKGFNVNLKLVEIGALLHDIGRSKTHSVNHVIIGSEIARSLGLPEPLVLIIERHAGGGITSEEARKLGWPSRSYVPETLEEKIVNYADKLIEGERVVPITRTLKKFSEELGETHPAVERIKKLHEEFLGLIGDINDPSNSS